MRHLVVLAGFFVAACVPRALVADARDRDDDGHVAWQLGGDDCDDAEPTANPSEPELCGDGIDNDCDGATDDDGTNAATWYPDLDRDGFAVDQPVTACTQPLDHRASLDAGLDCDDADANVHPGAVDAWYDGVDANCDDADDFDQDADTHRAPSGGGDDCDDLDESVHPGAPEVCGNHADDDCDGTHNTCAWSGDFEPTDVRSSVIVIGVEQADPVSVSVGDVTGDGLPDVAARNPNDDVAFVFFAPLSAVEVSGQADARIEVETSASFLQQIPDISGDLDGDGRNDLLLADYGSTPNQQLIFAAPLRGLAGVADASRLYTAAPDTTFPAQTWVLGDLDGDSKATWYSTQWEGDLETLEVDCFFVEGMPFGDTIEAVATLAWPECPELRRAPDIDGDGIVDLSYATSDSIEFIDGALTGLPPASTLASWPLSETDVGRIGTPVLWHDLDDDGQDDTIVRFASADGFEIVKGPFAGALGDQRM